MPPARRRMHPAGRWRRKPAEPPPPEETTVSPIETVQQIYAAFGRGDVPFILSCLAEDVEWEYGASPNPAPWLQPRRGRDEVPAFFDALATHCEFHRFQPTAVLGRDGLVVSLCDVDFTVRRSGVRVVEVDEVHLWHFDASGRVARFRHRADTLAQGLAFSPR
jgi:hypothetical protein